MSNQYCRGKMRSPTAMCALCAVSAVVLSPEDGVAGMVSGDGGAGRPGATGPAGIALYAVRAPRRREPLSHRHTTQGAHHMTAQPRAVERVIQPTPVIEGAGVRLRRSIATATLDYLDPFLLLDNFQSDDPDDYLAGFPWHPHRGIETVTYMLAGEVDHRDSIGNAGMIGAGDVQWMTAGGGIMHEEMPRPGADGHMGVFQLWVNLPAELKMTKPRGPDPRGTARRRHRHPRRRRRSRRRGRRGDRDLRGARIPGRVAAGRRELLAADTARARRLRVRVRRRGPVRRGLRPGLSRGPGR